jgi:hypothetical protein
MIPCSIVKVNRRSRGICCIHTQERRANETKKQKSEGSKEMEAICPSETLVDFQRFPQKCIYPNASC